MKSSIWRSIAVGVALLVASIGTAAAQSAILHTSGAWQAYVARSVDGTPLCGIGADSRHVTVQMFKKSWNILDGTKMRVLVGMDGKPRWTANAIGVRNVVELAITADFFAEFMNAFRSGNVMELYFPDGTEAPWLVSLRGSNEITRTFLGCVNRLIEATTPTQPHVPSAPSAPSQPGGQTPAPARPAEPAQPFGSGGRDI